jgi:hypothetical protein
MKVEELELFLDKLICVCFNDGKKNVWVKGNLRRISEDKVVIETYTNTYFIAFNSINQVKIPRE